MKTLILFAIGIACSGAAHAVSKATLYALVGGKQAQAYAQSVRVAASELREIRQERMRKVVDREEFDRREKRAQEVLIQAVEAVPEVLKSEFDHWMLDASALPELQEVTTHRDPVLAAKKLGERASHLFNELENVETRTVPEIYRELVLTYFGIHQLIRNDGSPYWRNQKEIRAGTRGAWIASFVYFGVLVPAVGFFGESSTAAILALQGAFGAGVTATAFSLLAQGKDTSDFFGTQPELWDEDVPFSRAFTRGVVMFALLPGLAGIGLPAVAATSISGKYYASARYLSKRSRQLYAAYFGGIFGEGEFAGLESRWIERLSQIQSALRALGNQWSCIEALALASDAVQSSVERPEKGGIK